MKPRVFTNWADDDRVILVTGCTDGWQYSLAVLSAQGGKNAFFHNLSLKSVFGGGLTKPSFCFSYTVFLAFKFGSFRIGFVSAATPGLNEIGYGNQMKCAFLTA